MTTLAAALGKIRCFAVDRVTGRPVAGVVVNLQAELDLGQIMPLGLLMSDSVGYVSFDLKRLGQLDSLSHLWLTPIAQPSNRIDLLAQFGKRNIDAEVLASVRELTIPLPGASRPTLSIPFTLAVDFGDTPKLTCKSATLPSVQNPDTFDYEFSPRSFVIVEPLRLGDADCETLVPSTMPAQEYSLSRVITRSASKRPLANSDLVPISLRERATPPHPKIKFGEVLDYRQRWYPLGHSLGGITYSLALAPGETVEIAVIDWSREDLASRTDTVKATESLLHGLNRERTIKDTVGSMLRENQDGWSVMGGTGGAASGEYEAVQWAGDHSVGGVITHSSGDRKLEADALQDLHDRVTQASVSMRSLNGTVVVQASQSERNSLQTRRVANHNHCHALTVQYYEVVRHFRLATEFAGRRKAVLVPFQPFDFDWQTALRFRTILESVLLDRGLAECFEAMLRLHYGSDLYLTTPVIDARPLATKFFVGTTAPLFIYANGKNNDTGLLIQKGSDVFIKAQGLVNYDSTGWYGPGGNGPAADRNYKAEGLLQGSLVGKIGAKNYQGGDTADWKADEDGRLVLLANHETNKTPQNQSFWLVTVEVTGPPVADASNLLPEPTTDRSVVTTLSSKASDTYLQERLLQSLNGDRAFYNSRIWTMLDPSELRMLLETALANRPDIIDSMDTTPLAVSGNYVAFSYDGHMPSWWKKEHLGDDPVGPTESIITLPSRGIFAEAMLGHCNACEQRDITRMWDWAQMTTEEPPAITGITPGPRGQTPSLTAAPLPQNVIQITQPQVAPYPTALAAALNVIGKPGIFRDMSGLEEVGSLLETLANGAVTSLAGAQTLQAAREKLANIQQQNGPSGRDITTSSAAEPAKTPTEQLDNLQVAKEVVKAADQLGLDRKEATTIARGIIDGGASRTGTLAGKTPAAKPIPQAKPDEVQIAIRVLDAWERPADADIYCTLTDDAIGPQNVSYTGVRRSANVSSANTMGLLQPMKGLTRGVLDIRVEMLSESYENLSSDVVDLSQGGVQYAFPKGTRFATFYARQAFEDVKVTVEAGETLANKVGSELSGKVTIGGTIKVVEASLETQGTRNWADEYGRTQAMRREFVIRVPKPQLSVSQATPRLGP